MKKMLFAMLALMLAACAAVLPIIAVAESAAVEPSAAQAQESAVQMVEQASETAAAVIPDPDPGEPFTWKYLATIAGAAAFTLLVVQFLKVPLDKVWKIPTRVFAYFVALAAMLVATAFTEGLTVNNALLAAVNAFLAALTAYGAYEVTFEKIGK